MRALKVLGIAESGTQVVCQPVPENEEGAAAPVAAVETFTLPIDERLRAAVRGDLSRIGQLEIEMESQLRPKEIQQRIRAGSTVEQVAAAAGCSPERIERYAYPVLLERSTIADKARRAHPVADGVVATRSVEALAGDSLTTRGQQASISWDAFRDERGWALLATWKAGRSENRATWTYHPGPAGGTVIARDDNAAMLVDPAPRPLRTVGPAAAVTSNSSTSRPGDTARSTAPARPVEPTPATPPQLDDESVLDEAPAGDELLDEQRRLVADTVTDTRSGSRPSPRGEATRAAADAALRAGELARVGSTGTDGPATPNAAMPHSTPPAPAPGGTSGAAHGSAARPKRGQRPQMPSWEDVLLGTRTSR